MNPTFPEAAEPVRQKIRELVERPKGFPFSIQESQKYLRFHIGRDTEKCPMGMLPNAICGAPALAGHIPDYDLTNYEVTAFANYWDNCTDAQQAVDTVWGDQV